MASANLVNSSARRAPAARPRIFITHEALAHDCLEAGGRSTVAALRGRG